MYQEQPEKTPREVLIALRVSEAERKLIAQQAKEQNKTISALLRENLGLDTGRQSKAGRGRAGKRKAA